LPPRTPVDRFEVKATQLERSIANAHQAKSLIISFSVTPLLSNEINEVTDCGQVLLHVDPEDSVVISESKSYKSFLVGTGPLAVPHRM
jgi:hypothetical protein